LNSIPIATADVLISEVGPRDGLQSISTIMSTPAKISWLDALHGAGIAEIEVGSFVPAKLLPQLADTADLVQHARTLSRWTVMALVPNVRGAEAAFRAGVHKITIPVSASRAHGLANVRKTPQEMVQEVERIIQLRDSMAPQVKVEAGVATAFGCTLQGPVPEADVLHMAEALARAGADEVGLSDTTGMANPAQVKRLFRLVKTHIGKRTGAAHMHNTRGLGLANCLAAFEEGVTTFDSSMGGLGGCPYAPGASGNVVTEDLVNMFESMGVRTGIDLEKLFAARTLLQAGIPQEPIYGMTPLAGLNKGFVYANGRLPATSLQQVPS
jgi:hydroxymethylglutaryl-CoA lyase